MSDFTERFKKIVDVYAKKEAKNLNHNCIYPEHILLGLLRFQNQGCVAMQILGEFEVDIPKLREDIIKRIKHKYINTLVETNNRSKIQNILDLAREEALRIKTGYICSEHLLLALLRDKDSISSQSLAMFNIDYYKVLEKLRELLGFVTPLAVGSVKVKTTGLHKNSNVPTLAEYSNNLNEMAQNKLFDPIIGREKEIERIMQILCRKTKKNPILVGEAGVGKTAIVEGLAQKICLGEVPDALLDKKIHSLDMASLVAGTKYRGEFEDRIKKILKEIIKNPSIILFIDEVHTIIGAGSAEGAIDAAHMLKPSLARGEIQTIAATTTKEYKRYLERDMALERRFQLLKIEEPSVKETVQILIGLRKNYEKHHGIEFTKESIIAAAKLTERFIAERYLPDKAIDVLDEAASRISLQKYAFPEKIKKTKRENSNLEKEKTELVKRQDFERAAKVRDIIRQNEDILKTKIDKWRKKKRIEKVYVTKKDITDVIRLQTGIPVSEMAYAEKTKLLKLEKELSQRIIGQKIAISKVSNAIRRGSIALEFNRSPISSFLFLGPTGVGKTEFAKAIAHSLFKDEKFLIRFDMSEYMELHSVSKFVGSPPGYVGYEEGGLLTEAIKRNRYSVLLFDEFEKSHPDIQNILLQVLDEGFLTDANGDKINFKETIIILTSNLGTDFFIKGNKLGFSDGQKRSSIKEEMVLDEVKKHFNPEFLNRINDIIIFDKLTNENIKEILNKHIDILNKNFFKYKLYIELESTAIKFFIENGYSEQYGARALKRVVQNDLENKIVSMILSNKVKPYTKLTVSANKNIRIAKSIIGPQEYLKIQKEHHDDNEIENIWKDIEIFTENKNLLLNNNATEIPQQK